MARTKFKAPKPFFGTPSCDDDRKQIVPINSIKRDPENARLHPERNLSGIRGSLRKRGQQQPIVVSKDGVIVVGNGRHEAAELEGWTHIWIVVTHLTGAELRAYGIQDNQTGQTSTWDLKILSEHITDIKGFFGDAFDGMEDLGFEDFELEPLLASSWTPPVATDDQPPPQEKASVKTPDERGGRDPHADLEEGDRASDECSITCTPNQRITIDDAIERFRLVNGDLAITEGRAIELICADYMSGAPLPDLTREQLINGEED